MPAAEVEGPGFTLVNLQTTFYTEASTIDRRLNILGFVVDVHITPATLHLALGRRQHDDHADAGTAVPRDRRHPHVPALHHART